jgi:DNA repair protein RadC
VEHETGSIQVKAELKDETVEEITNFGTVKQRYKFLRERPKEHFYAVFLRSGNEVIGDKLIGLGNTSTAPVDLKDIARTAVLTNATAVILVHNHPSTNPEPTAEDRKATQEIKDGLELFGIDLLDHVIISRTNSHSMKQAGTI